MAPRKEKKRKKGQRQNKRNTEEVQRFQKIRDTAKNYKMRDQNFKTKIIFNRFWGYNSHCQ